MAANPTKNATISIAQTWAPGKFKVLRDFIARTCCLRRGPPTLTSFLALSTSSIFYLLALSEQIKAESHEARDRSDNWSHQARQAATSTIHFNEHQHQRDD